MSIEFNHTIIWTKDKKASAEFLARILGVEVSPQWGPFAPIRISNGVTLDFGEKAEFNWQHYAFLVTEPEFDAALERLRSAGVTIYADSHDGGEGQVNHLYGGRGCYFYDANEHIYELITRPYGEVPQRWIESPDGRR